MEQTPAGTPATGAPSVGGQADGAGTEAQPGFAARGRLRRRVRFLRKARELAYRDLGGLVFNLHRFGQRNDALVLAKLSTLGQIDTELRSLEASLEERQPVTVLREAGITACPRCAAIHGSEDRFCPNCGLPMSRRVDLPIAAPAAAPPPAQPAQAAPAQPAPAQAAPQAPPAPPTPAEATRSWSAPAAASGATAARVPAGRSPSPPLRSDAPSPPPAPARPQAPTPGAAAPPSAPTPRAPAPPGSRTPAPAAPATPAGTPPPPAPGGDRQPPADAAGEAQEEPTEIVHPRSGSA